MICDLEKNAENVMVPRMILQPIVENSVFHGFADKEENCMINIYAEVRNDILEICIRDNGEGMSTENLDKIVAEETKDDNTHHGIGINNVRRRLEVIYGETSKIRVESKEGKGTAVFININI